MQIISFTVLGRYSSRQQLTWQWTECCKGNTPVYNSRPCIFLVALRPALILILVSFSFRLLDLGFDDFVRVGSIRKIAKPVLPYSVHATGSDDQELKELQNMLKSDLQPSEKM